ncbi:myeloid-associated differentiation marker homolog [Engraulis encrasicolus]|uniref:myeloid-associated differentiation marker homolog n=1 Tax=Engraulis encrasicolus TaxID=184585 RepID=UPI002FCE830C
MGCLSISQSLRIVEAALCGLSVILFWARHQAISPYGVWCEFCWVFGVIVALAILVVETFKLDLLLAVCLQHSWDDLATGLTLTCAEMVLSASLLYAIRVMPCKTCFLEIVCVILSFGAALVFLVDGVMAKIKSKSMTGGYLAAICGMLRFTEAVLSCILLVAFASYFFAVGTTKIPLALGWCLLVYLVCFVGSVLIMLFNLIKLLKALLCVDKIEVIFNIVAVVLYISALILWPIYGKRHYYSVFKSDSEGRSVSNYGFRYSDLMTVLALTVVNLILYAVDMILSLVNLNNR